MRMSSEPVAGTPSGLGGAGNPLTRGDELSTTMTTTTTTPGQRPNHGARPDEAPPVPDQKAPGTGDFGGAGGAGGDTPSGADPHPGSRRSHPKSRTGCRTCKKRKIKCDEHKPCCRNCIKHAVRCDFLSSHPASEAQGHGHGHGTSSASPSPVPRYPGGVSGSGPGPGLGGLNMADLELMHNYTTLTFATLAGEPCVREVMRTTVVRMGLRCDYLMRTVLAVSALHLAHYRKGDRREAYVAMASRHYQAASQEAIPLMGRELDLTMENCENLFMFSRLTLYFALGCPRKEDATLLEGSNFPQWLFLSGGIDPIIKALDPRNYEGPLKPLFAYGISRARLVMGEAKDDDPDSPLLSGLQASVNKVCASEPELLSVYNKAISQLRHVLRLVMPAPHGRAAAAAGHFGAAMDLDGDRDGADGDAGKGASAEADRNPPQRLGKALDSGDIFITIWMVARDFLPLLRGPDARQEAVAIFAHFLVILKKLEPQWWSEGWPEHLIERIWEMLDQEHRLWIQWPVEELGWVPP